MKKFTGKKQQGFSILAVILVIVAVIVAIGVWALSGQTNTSNSGNSTSDIQAASIMNDSGAIKLSFDTLLINGSTDTSIVFVPNVASTGSAPNMLDPTNGVQVPKPNTNAIKASPAATEGFWVYNKTAFKGNAVGTSAGVDSVILVAGVKKGVCERINNTLYGATTIPASALATSAAATTGATAAAPTTTAALDISAVAGAAGWSTGCVSTTAGADDNIFFRVLKAN